MSEISFRFTKGRSARSTAKSGRSKGIPKHVNVFSTEKETILSGMSTEIPSRLTTVKESYDQLKKILTKGQTLFIYLTLGMDQLVPKHGTNSRDGIMFKDSEWDYMLRIVRALAKGGTNIVAADSAGNKALGTIPYNQIANYLHSGYTVVVQLLKMHEVFELSTVLDKAVKKEGKVKNSKLKVDELTLALGFDTAGSSLVKRAILNSSDATSYFQPDSVIDSDELDKVASSGQMEAFYSEKYVSQIVHTEKPDKTCDVETFEHNMSNEMYRGATKPPLLTKLSKLPLDILSLILGYFPCKTKKIIALHHNPDREEHFNRLLLYWFNSTVGSAGEYFL